MTEDELNVKITADTSDFTSGIKKAGDAAEDFGNGAENAATRIGNAFRALKTELVTLGIGKLLRDSVNFAGDLEQNIGGAESVFKSYSGMIRDTAKEAAVSLGLAESDYLATATKMGALFQGTGLSAEKSADMTVKAMQRAADVASIMGIGIDEAMNSITGAAKGNFTMMDNLGVAINDTTLQIYAQEKGLGKLETTQQKVNAAMQMFMDKTEYAAGNYAKENDTYAGSLNTLKAEFKNFMTEAGTTLIPTATAGIKILSSALQDVSPIVVTLGNGIGLIGDTLALVPEPLVKTVTGVITATVAFKKLNAVLGVTGSRLALIATLALFVFGKLKEAAEKNNEIVSDASEDSAEDIGIATDAQNDLTDSVKETGKALNALAGFDEITKLSGNKSGLSLVSDSDFQDMSDYSAAIGNIQDQFGELDTSASDTFGSISELWKNTLDSFDVEDIRRTAQELGEGFIDVFQTTFDFIDREFGTHFSEWYSNTVEFWKNAGKEIQKFLEGEEIHNVELDTQFFGVAGYMQEEAVQYLREGMDPTEVKNLVESKYLTTPEAKEWYENVLNGGHRITLKNLAKWQNNLVESGQLDLDPSELFSNRFHEYIREKIWNPEADHGGGGRRREDTNLPDSYDSSWRHGANVNPSQLSDPLTEQGAYNAFTAANASSSGVTEIRTTVELDGDKIGESVTSYQNGMAYQQNGR